MFIILGLNDDDKMVLYGHLTSRPSLSWLEEAAEGSHFKQILVVEADAAGCAQVARYKYHTTPVLEEVFLI